jgi:GNAT superfamily N-acetyltransferase
VTPDTWEPVVLAESQIPDAGTLAGCAFSTDPLAIHAEPDPVTRERVSCAFSTWMLRFSHLFAEVYVTPGRLEGLLILHRTPVEFTDARLRESGFEGVAAAVGRAAFSRFNGEFMRIMGHAETGLHQAATPGGWLLDTLAVDRLRQGCGIGGRLIQWLNDFADAEAAPVSLVTYQPRNVTFYARHGYPVICEGTEPVSGVRYWGFERTPS